MVFSCVPSADRRPVRVGRPPRDLAQACFHQRAHFAEIYLTGVLAL